MTSLQKKNLPKQRNREKDDVFAQLKSHLLLNLSRTKRKQREYESAVTQASHVLEFDPESYEALWAMGKAKREFSEARDTKDSSNIELLESALIDLRKAIKLAPQNLELHRYTIRVKEEVDAQKEEIIQSDSPSIPCEGIDDSKNTNDNPSIPCEGI